MSIGTALECSGLLGMLLECWLLLLLLLLPLLLLLLALLLPSISLEFQKSTPFNYRIPLHVLWNTLKFHMESSSVSLRFQGDVH